MSFDGFFFFSFSFILFAEAKAEIIGPSIRYLTPGSTLKLMCRITQNTETSAFIFWYNDNRMINYDFDRGINVSTEAGKFQKFIFFLEFTDFTCKTEVVAIKNFFGTYVRKQVTFNKCFNCTNFHYIMLSCSLKSNHFL